MPEIMIRCPNTRTIVSTGLTTEKIKLSSLSNLTLRVLCPEMGQKDAWIYDRGKVTKFKISL